MSIGYSDGMYGAGRQGAGNRLVNPNGDGSQGSVLDHSQEASVGDVDRPRSCAALFGKPEELSRFVLDSFHRSRRAKFYVEREWIVALLYYIGEQYVVVNQQTGVIEFNPPAQKNRVRLVVNRLLPSIEHRIARILRTAPVPVVLPESGKDVDRDKAKCASKILQGLAEKMEDEIADQDALLWADLCSACFYKTWWNPLGGDNAVIEATIDPQTGEPKPVIGSDGLPVSYPEGDIETEVVSPFEVYPDPTASSMKTLHWLIQAKELDLDTARALFPDHADQIQAGTMEELYGRSWGASSMPLRDFPLFAPGSLGDPQRANRVLLLEMWEAPVGKRGVGMHVVVANRQVILAEATPEGYRSIPYRMVASVKVPGRFWPTSVTTNAISLQDEINRRHSQLVENMNAHGYMRYKAPRGAAVQPLEMEADKIYYYIPVQGRELEPIQPPNLPPELIPHLDSIHRQFDEVVGLHDVSRGQNPSTARTGRAVFFLQEQDETRLGPFVKRWLQAKAGVHSDRLRLMQTYYDTERIVHLFGTDGIETIRFKKEDLGVGTRVVIDPRSNLPLSRAAKMDTIMEMQKLGMFDPMNPGAKSALRMMDLQDLTAMFEPDAIHRARAREENYEVERAVGEGRVPQIRPPSIYEDHNIHLDDPSGHRMFTNTSTWDQATPEQRAPMEQHIAMHEQFQMMIAQASMAVQVPGQQLAPPPPVDPGGHGIPPPAKGSGKNAASSASSASSAPRAPGMPGKAENQAAQATGDRGLDRAQGLPAGRNPPAAPIGGGLGSNY